MPMSDENNTARNSAPGEEATPRARLTAVEPAAPPSRSGFWAGLVAFGALVLGKLKFVLVALKAVPLGKFALTSLSMATMIVFESVRYGWAFGLGFVLLILVHELGHGWAIKRAGLQAGWPVFIPFFGASISLKDRPPSPGVDADISYAGPFYGTAAALACVVLWYLTDNRVFLVLAHTGFFLNLFNLVPMRPLDGGAVAAVVVKGAWVVGALLLGAMFLLTHAPQLLLIGVMAFFNRNAMSADVEVTPEERRLWAVRYFGLCAFLGTAIFFSHRLLTAPGV